MRAPGNRASGRPPVGGGKRLHSEAGPAAREPAFRPLAGAGGTDLPGTHAAGDSARGAGRPRGLWIPPLCGKRNNRRPRGALASPERRRPRAAPGGRRGCARPRGALPAVMYAAPDGTRAPAAAARRHMTAAPLSAPAAPAVTPPRSARPAEAGLLQTRPAPLRNSCCGAGAKCL